MSFLLKTSGGDVIIFLISQVLLIALDDAIDNMLTMYDNHNSIKSERVATFTGGAVPMEFYMSQGLYLTLFKI